MRHLGKVATDCDGAGAPALARPPAEVRPLTSSPTEPTAPAPRSAPWARGSRQTLAERLVLERLPDARRRDLLFLRSHGRLPSHRNPRTLMEKVNWRIVHDRRPVIAWACDKLATKEFAETCPLVRVPTTYWSGTDLGDLAGVELPKRWILKPNSASGLVHEGSGRCSAGELAALGELTAGWHPPATSRELCEWAYLEARPLLLVEEFVGEATPIDYKVLVFHGEPRIVQVDLDRFRGHKMSFYTTDWTMLEAHSRFPRGEPVPKPPHLARMLEAARFLAGDLEFVRVDLYDAGGEVWFGELTPYPGSGLMRIAPARYDREWGGWWCLPEHRR